MRLRSSARVAARVVPLVAVAVLVVVYRHEVASGLHRLAGLSPVILLVLPLYWVWNQVAACSWQSLIGAVAPDEPRVSAVRLAVVRLQSQAVNMALPFAGGVGGGAVRIGLTRRLGLAPAATAAVLDDIAGGVGALLFISLGIGLVPGSLWGMRHAHLALAAAGGGVLLWLGVVWLAPFLASRLSPHRRLGQAMRVLAQHRRRLAPGFAAAVAWHLVERVFTAGEIWLAFAALGLDAGAPQALFVHAASVAVALLLFFVPGQPGASEASIAAACTVVGIDPATGLAVAFVRRARQLVVTAAGLAALSFAGRRAIAP